MESHGILTFFLKRSKSKKSLARTSSSKTKQCAQARRIFRIPPQNKHKQRGGGLLAPPPSFFFNPLVFCFGFWFFLKWKGHFSFWGSALQVFGQCGGANADSDGRAGEIRCIERSAKKANLVCKAEDWRWSSTWCRFSSIRMTDVYTGLPQSEV